MPDTLGELMLPDNRAISDQAIIEALRAVRTAGEHAATQLSTISQSMTSLTHKVDDLDRKFAILEASDLKHEVEKLKDRVNELERSYMPQKEIMSMRDDTVARVRILEDAFLKFQGGAWVLRNWPALAALAGVGALLAKQYGVHP